MARIDAMKELPWLPSLFIFLLFLAIETAPIFSKLISPMGEYDIKLADHELTIKEWSDSLANIKMNESYEKLTSEVPFLKDK